MSFGEILCLILPIVGVIVWRIVAGANILFISTIARFVWNMSCLIGSYIPFIGWFCAKLIIATDENEAMAKRNAMEIADIADELGSDMAAQSAARSREEQRRIEEQAELERRISSETGRTAHIHGNTVDIGDKTYDLNSVKKKLKIQ